MESAEAVKVSSPQAGLSGDAIAGRRRQGSRDLGRRLRGQTQVNLFQQDLQILGRLRAARQDQPPPTASQISII